MVVQIHLPERKKCGFALPYLHYLCIFHYSSPVGMPIKSLTVCIVLLALALGACRPEPQPGQVLTPEHADFEDLFALEDTISLGSSVIIGDVSMLDVSPNGELLVLDIQGKTLAIFSPKGEPIHTLSISECDPEAELNFFSHSRFIGNEHVLVLTNKGGMILNRDSACVAYGRGNWPAFSILSSCIHQDTIFAMSVLSADGTSIGAFGTDLNPLAEFSLPPAEFPRMFNVALPLPGRSMGCFADGLWWVYGESFDATPRFENRHHFRFRPDFYRVRTRDYPEMPVVDQSNWAEAIQILDEASKEASSVIAMYELAPTTRLVLYDHIASGDNATAVGALIASHDDDPFSASTFLPGIPASAKNGMLYFDSDPEESLGNEVSNPKLISYRFIPPRD